MSTRCKLFADHAQGFGAASKLAGLKVAHYRVPPCGRRPYRLIQETGGGALQNPSFRTDLVDFNRNCARYDLSDGTVDPGTFPTSKMAGIALRALAGVNYSRPQKVRLIDRVRCSPAERDGILVNENFSSYKW